MVTGSAEPAKGKEAKNVIVVAVSEPQHDLPSTLGSFQELNNKMFFTSSAWVTALDITSGSVFTITPTAPETWGTPDMGVNSIPDSAIHSFQVQTVVSAYGKCLTSLRGHICTCSGQHAVAGELEWSWRGPSSHTGFTLLLNKPASHPQYNFSPSNPAHHLLLLPNSLLGELSSAQPKAFPSPSSQQSPQAPAPSS